MHIVSGIVTYNEAMSNPLLNNYVEERMDEWLVKHHMEDNVMDYEVAFFDEESPEDISCLVLLQMGPYICQSWQNGVSTEEALEKSLWDLHFRVQH